MEMATTGKTPSQNPIQQLHSLFQFQSGLGSPSMSVLVSQFQGVDVSQGSAVWMTNNPHYS